MMKTFRFFTVGCNDVHDEETSKCDGVMIICDNEGTEFVPMFRSKVLAEMEVESIMKQPEPFKPENRPSVIEVELSQVL